MGSPKDLLLARMKGCIGSETSGLGMFWSLVQESAGSERKMLVKQILEEEE